MFGLSLAAPEQAARLEEDQGQLINGSRGGVTSVVVGRENA